MSSSWVDALLPAQHRSDVIAALERLRLRDAETTVELGPLDLAALSVIKQFLDRSGNLVMEFPRGRTEFAVLAGFFVQLDRIYARRADPEGRAAPVVVVGLDTMLQERLSRIRVGTLSLGAGLNPLRLRYDGIAVDLSGHPQPTTTARSGLIYLNTRVGWPMIKGVDRAGVVIIDRTTFGSVEILERALDWAEGHRASVVIVLADEGDRDTAEAVARRGRAFETWTWTRPLIDEIVYAMGRSASGSLLSTNALLHQDWRPPDAVVCQAELVSERLESCLSLLIKAGQVDGPLPRPLAAAKQLVNGLSHALSTIDEYNQWAALDHRTTSFASLQRLVESSGTQTLAGAWANRQETIWTPLRYEVLQLYSLIHDENPKLFALAYAIDRLKSDHPGVSIVIRVPSEAAGQAMQSDLLDLGIKSGRDHGTISWLPMSQRHPWCSVPVIEILPGAVPPWWAPLLWSGEGTIRIHLTYTHEVRMLAAAVRRSTEGTEQALASAFAAMNLGSPPLHSPTGAVGRPYLLQVDQRKGAGVERPEVDLSVDPSLLFGELELEEGTPLPRDAGVVTGIVRARPVTLRPGGETWWVRDGSTVEVLVGRNHKYRALEDLRPGDTVIVPRGEGREALFTQLVKVVHSDGDIAAFEVFLSRWRNACMTLRSRAGSWKEAEEQLQSAGSRVGWQAIRWWALGETIGPDEARDVFRVGRLVGDEMLKKEWRRLNEMMSEVRRLHVRLGFLLSAGLEEALRGGGTNLEKLSRLLKVDVTELLEQFEMRTVAEVGAATDIRAASLGRVERRNIA